MITTREAAKRMIQSVYGQDFKVRFVKSWTTAQDPYGIRRTLSWRKWSAGSDKVEVIDHSQVQS